ncbi:MAG: GNAT family N-acetyltransferase [Hyphomicrobium sp.]
MTDDISIVRATRAHVAFFKNTWIPENLVLRATVQNWSYRLFPWDQILQHDPFDCRAAVQTSDSVEGLLAMTVQDAFVKVEFLSTAPWNFGATPRRRGIGSSLLAAAVVYSKNCGHHGTIELSSTPESERFYRHVGLVPTGEEDHEGLNVFRLERSAAPAFLVKYPAPRIR